MSGPLPLHEMIDLSCHAVVEASAGTGKTYTIERLVARILRDVPEATIERLLLLTYTEKATGELRERIRGFLGDACEAAEGDEKQRLRQAVESFDTAQIFTIHGFCQRVLQEYAFENNQLFDLELSGDDTVVRRLFRDQLRRVWPREYLPNLPDDVARELAEKEFMEADILRLALSLQPGEKLLPEMPDSVEDLVPRFVAAIEDLRRLVGDGGAFMAGYWQLAFGKADEYKGLTKRSIEPIWDGLWQVVGGELDEDGLRQALAWRGGIGYSRFVRGDDACWQGFRVLVPPELRLPDGGIAATEACPLLAQVIDVLSERLEPALSQGRLLVEDAQVGTIQLSAQALRDRYREFKQEQGLLDFDDMLHRVHWALSPENPRSAVLLAALRSKYLFGLVDEFQDTDPVQWEIFRRIFVEHDGEPQRLFLIGDPKQAIYGFRGADVNTYLGARDFLLTRFGSRVRYSLATNYRSIPVLLDGLNRVFSSPTWFPPTESGARIAYEAVDWPEEFARGVRVVRDGTRRSPLCVVHVDQPAAELTLAKCRWRMAQFIGEEVARLLANRNEFQFQDPDTAEVRTLSPADLCILVRRRASAGPVEEKLRSLGIPYTFYKKTGIYQAPEALHTSLLLGALANPDAAQALHPALLSRFFGRTPRELAERPAEVEQATREHFERWRELCRERRWARLFHALLEDTGLAFREAGQPDGDRRLANFRQLFHDLVGLAEREALDVVGLREQLDLRRRRSVAVDSEEDLHHLDTEAPKVTIMTMHASKGLQFPIVFVADGFSALGRVSGNMIRYHGAEGRVTELKTSQGFLGEAQASQEAADETRRLFYVALTRARFKVYVPFGWKETKSGADPLTPLLTPAFAPFWDRQEEPQNDQMVCHLDCRGEIVGTGYPAPPIDGALDAIPVPPEPPPGWDEISEALAELRLPPPLGRWQRQVDSYSSLAHDHSGRNQMKFGDSEHEEAADDWTAPLAVDTLVPPGASAGSALHEILELADFATVSRYDDPGRLLATEDGFAALVDQSMARNGLVNQERGPTASTRLELAGMVWRALTTPLTAGGFRLGDVPPEDRQTELEFHLSEGEELLGFDAGIPPDRRGLLNGFVDLLYRWQGRYFIVDWKSNALAGGYAPAEILASMEEHEYTLQYRIYALALAAWLGRCLPDFSPDRHLGGVYYLYVRGLNGADASAGVFHQPLDGACLEEYRQEVLDRLARRS